MQPVVGHNRIRNLLTLADLRSIQDLSVFVSGVVDVAPLQNLAGDAIALIGQQIGIGSRGKQPFAPTADPDLIKGFDFGFGTR